MDIFPVCEQCYKDPSDCTCPVCVVCATQGEPILANGRCQSCNVPKKSMPTQSQIIERAEEVLALIVPSTVDRRKGCLYHALAMSTALAEAGYDRVILQAGSASFLFDPSSQEPLPSHYSYVFEESATDIFLALMSGQLPEMHVWVAAKETPSSDWVIIDATTKHLPALTGGLGMQWVAPEPPDCLWVTAKELPTGWHYEPCQPATELAYRLSQPVFEFLKERLLACRAV